jgi:AraC-like DNA-binding protein
MVGARRAAAREGGSCDSFGYAYRAHHTENAGAVTRPAAPPMPAAAFSALSRNARTYPKDRQAHLLSASCCRPLSGRRPHHASNPHTVKSIQRVAIIGTGTSWAALFLARGLHVTATVIAPGVAAERTLAGAGITPEDLNDPYFFISRHQVSVVFDNAPQSGQYQPAATGRLLLPDRHGFYGHALLSSAMVRDAVNFGLAYRELATPIVDIELAESGEAAAWLIGAMPDFTLHEATGSMVQEYQSAILLSLHKSISGNAFRLSSASFACAAPAGAAHCHSVLNCPIAFDAPRTGLRFDKDGLEQMAALLGLHARTLRRTISAEGSTYQHIVDEVRFKLATTCLTRTEMTHESISERLGFSDASSFRRAFKRWAHISPNDYKRRLQGQRGRCAAPCARSMNSASAASGSGLLSK